MKKSYLFVPCGMLLGIHVFWADDPLALYRDPKSLMYLEYLGAFQATSYALVLLLLVCTIGVVSFISSEKFHAPSPGQWLFAFWGILLPLVGLNIYVNPHGIFPWNHFSSLTSSTTTGLDFMPTAMRNYKLELFRDLDTPADVVIMGSSRAYTLPSDYVQAVTGYSTFNMAVGLGGVVDFLPMGKFVLSERADAPPVVFLVELAFPDLVVRKYPMPISLIRYLPSEKRFEAINYAFHDGISVQSVSDLIFQTTYARLYPQTPRLSFQPDGTAIRKAISKEEYKRGVANLRSNIDKGYQCNRLNPEGKRLIEAFVQLAEKNQTAILFYRSPLNADYLEIGEIDHPLYKKCEALFLAYMDDLVEQYPNVLFRDLTYYQPISSLRWDGYYDAHHLKPKAAQMLIDVLAPDISDAAAWALRQRR